MKILLTGSTGNLGSHIARLPEHQFLNIGRDNWAQLANIKEGEYETAIHCAYDLKNSLFSVPDVVLDSNILSTAKLLRVCKEKKVGRFVFISSCAVYGDSSNSAENKPCEPVSMNGHTKLFNEELVKNFCQANGINYLILRVFNTYGGDDQFSVVQKIINAAKNKMKFTLVNEGVSERDFIHVNDVALILNKLLPLDLKNETINIGSGDSVRIVDIVNAVEKKIGPIEVEQKSNASEAIFSRANIKKMKSLIDYKPMKILDYINGLKP